MHKKTDYRVSDAIPAVPASFERTVETTLQTVCEKRAGKTRTAFTPTARPMRMKKGAPAALVAAAMLLFATTAFAATVLLTRDRYTPKEYLSTPQQQREASGSMIPDVEQTIVNAAPKTGTWSVKMLPEMENADALNGWRLAKGQPAYSEEDWGWIRGIRPEIEEVLHDGHVFACNIRLHTDHAQCFTYLSTGQRVDASFDRMFYTVEGDPVNRELFGMGGGPDSDTLTEDGITLNGSTDSYSLPQSGRIFMTVEIGIRDANVDDMADIGLLGILSYTFSFDADSAEKAKGNAFVTERALHGDAVLSIDGDGYRNMPVSLDGVVLEETVQYDSTGVFVTYRVKTAPDGWTEEMKNQLVSPSTEFGKFAGLYVAYRLGDDPEERSTDYHHKMGEYTAILPLFPNDHEKLRQSGLSVVLKLRCIDTFEDAPVGDTWEITTLPSNGWDLTTRSQALGTFPLPLP